MPAVFLRLAALCALAGPSLAQMIPTTSSMSAAVYPFSSTNGLLTIAGSSTNATALGESKIALIKNVLNLSANLSWEIGVHAQSLIEIDYPGLAIWSPVFSPSARSPYPEAVNAIASTIVAAKPANILPLITDGAVGDPASLGIAVTLANFTLPSGTKNRSSYALAAQEQIRFLMDVAPRTSDGAISHRADMVQLWADFVYMAPPFLAYYGVLNGNLTLLQASYDQCRLYRNYLRTDSGLWRHIVLGSYGTDPGLWATGNAWAAAGMLRVLATLLNSNYAGQFASQMVDLASWSSEIVEASFVYQKTSDSFLPNYFNATNSNISFSDASSTALLSAVSYRLAQLSLGNHTIPNAERARLAIYTAVSPVTGILAPVVDPLSFGIQGTSSPEAEAFVLLLESAWRDWVIGGGASTTEVDPPKAGNVGPTAGAPTVTVKSGAPRITTSWLLGVGALLLTNLLYLA